MVAEGCAVVSQTFLTLICLDSVTGFPSVTSPFEPMPPPRAAEFPLMVSLALAWASAMPTADGEALSAQDSVLFCTSLTASPPASAREASGSGSPRTCGVRIPPSLCQLYDPPPSIRSAILVLAPLSCIRTAAISSPAPSAVLPYTAEPSFTEKDASPVGQNQAPPPITDAVLEVISAL